MQIKGLAPQSRKISRFQLVECGHVGDEYAWSAGSATGKCKAGERGDVEIAMRMLSIFKWVLAAMVATSALNAQEKTKKAPPVLAPVQDVPGLPRVLLIGDSISMGYTLPVRKLLEGKANVHRIPANGGPSKNIVNYDKWLGSGKWDVIHFNHGIHDLKHMPDGKRQVEPADYEKNLRAIVARLKQTGAKLIFATTTPIPPPPLKPERTFGDVKEYNAIATRVMKELGVPVNDLYGHMLPEFERYHRPSDLHYTDEGSEFLAKKVASEIESALKR